jgi:hypothetical protein
MEVLRKVFRKTSIGEEGPISLIYVKKGDTFRLVPIDELDTACPKGWMVATSNGQILNGVPGISVKEVSKR